jgi:hypothetical protein
MALRSSLSQQLLPLLLILLSSTGCVHRLYPGSKCEWPPERPSPLDLSEADQRAHLSRDAVAAEDLAIRYADWRIGNSPGYSQLRDGCMAALFAAIAKTHSVTPVEVRQALAGRGTIADLATILSFAVLYIAFANAIAGRAGPRFLDAGSLAVGLFAIIAISILVGMGGMLAGEIWSLVVEMYRLDNGHISYRAARVPWAQHRLAFFVICVLLFWLIAAFHYCTCESRRARHHASLAR